MNNCNKLVNKLSKTYLRRFSSRQFIKSSNSQDSNSTIKLTYDYTRHTLLKDLYMFLFRKDNIGYILHDRKSSSLIGVDFGEFDISSRVVHSLEKGLNSKFKYLLTTHSHNDHCGGNSQWKSLLGSELEIITGDAIQQDSETKNQSILEGKHYDYVEIADTRMRDLQTLSIGDLTIACLFTPGHLKSHVAFVVTQVNDSATKIPFLFCGDTLFIGGCGRVFNCTHDELFDSLKKLSFLPNDTLIFPGHEYTVKNLEFAMKLDPENIFIKDKLEWARKVVAEGNFTVGSRIIEERIYNPFLRAGDDYFLKLTGESNPYRAFKKLRMLKDQF